MAKTPEAPREIGLDSITGLLGMGPDMLLEVLAMAIGAVGTGTEFTGDQLSRLGDLQQQLADKLSDLTGEKEGG